MPADTDLAVAYGYDNSVVTKRGQTGGAMSSVSAAYIQAAMLELAELRPGATPVAVAVPNNDRPPILAYPEH
ncbi:hypothetical protein ABZ671_16975 [Micromonospora sp. NPDC006766]|uniref:hypothetical protein n=1 Tax=Micromonospora sp. NPDC006766 TaxID=3154778 RepID=UPI003410B0EA